MMSTLLLTAMIATLGILMFGLFNMAIQGKKSPQLSQKMMRWRVILQVIALVIFSLLLLRGTP